MAGEVVLVVRFRIALICSRAWNLARQIGQLFAWYRRLSAHELQRHRWRQGRIRVSRVSHIHMTHSEPLSSMSSSCGCCNRGNSWRNHNTSIYKKLYTFKLCTRWLQDITLCHYPQLDIIPLPLPSVGHYPNAITLNRTLLLPLPSVEHYPLGITPAITLSRTLPHAITISRTLPSVEHYSCHNLSRTLSPGHYPQ